MSIPQSASLCLQAKLPIPRTPKPIPCKLCDYNNSAPAVPLPTHVEYITSPSNPFVKHCLKLRRSSSYRHSHGSALVVGTAPIRQSRLSILTCPREICRFQESKQHWCTSIDCLLLLDKAKIPDVLDGGFPAQIVRVSSLVMEKLSGLKSSDATEAIALMRMPKSFHNLEDIQLEADLRSLFPSPRRILVLDGIQDPGNLGTLLRSAMAFGWGGAFLLPGCCDPFNEKALRASRGASFQLPIISGSWVHLEALRNEFQMKMLAGHPSCEQGGCWVSQGLSDSLADTPVCLVLGSEGGGLSAKSLQECELLSIPMAGEFESLNVSTAGGIFLYLLQPRR